VGASALTARLVSATRASTLTATVLADPDLHPGEHMRARTAHSGSIRAARGPAASGCPASRACGCASLRTAGRHGQWGSPPPPPPPSPRPSPATGFAVSTFGSGRLTGLGCSCSDERPLGRTCTRGREMTSWTFTHCPCSKSPSASSVRRRTHLAAYTARGRVEGQPASVWRSRASRVLLHHHREAARLPEQVGHLQAHLQHADVPRCRRPLPHHALRRRRYTR
jgi:hypothetical protein